MLLKRTMGVIENGTKASCTRYCEAIERSIAPLIHTLECLEFPFNPRYAALRLLERDTAALLQIERHLGFPIQELPTAKEMPAIPNVRSEIMDTISKRAAKLAADCVHCAENLVVG